MYSSLCHWKVVKTWLYNWGINMAFKNSTTFYKSIMPVFVLKLVLQDIETPKNMIQWLWTLGVLLKHTTSVIQQVCAGSWCLTPWTFQKPSLYTVTLIVNFKKMFFFNNWFCCSSLLPLTSLYEMKSITVLNISARPSYAFSKVFFSKLPTFW